LVTLPWQARSCLTPSCSSSLAKNPSSVLNSSSQSSLVCLSSSGA
jgi:hypothetical protein